MTIFTVTTAGDVVNPGDGKLSLREAVAQANATAAADTIVFAKALEGQTLVLTGGELLVNRDITIDGDQNNDGTAISVSGNNASRITHIVGEATDVVFKDLTLVNGYTTSSPNQFGGSAILMDRGSLLLSSCNILDNHGSGNDFGEAIVANSVKELTIIDSTVGDNSTNNAGGALYQTGGGRLNIVNSNFFGNEVMVALL